MTTFAVEADADLRATGIVADASGTTFTLHDRATGGARTVRSPLVGSFNVSNALAAGATAVAAGFDIDDIARGLAVPLAIPGRMERVGERAPFTVLVDYAHTPVALEHALAGARELRAGGRVILVFGCGGDRDREKRPLMGEAAAEGADYVVVTSDNPRSEDPAAIVEDIRPGLRHGAPSMVELDRRSAIRLALQRAEPGDVVVIAGKGHERGQSAGGVVVPFDDREVAREELEQLGWR